MTFFSLLELDCFVSSLPSGLWLVHEEEEEMESDPSVIYTQIIKQIVPEAEQEMERKRDRLALKETTDSFNGETDRVNCRYCIQG